MPEDFMLQLTSSELSDLRSQIATLHGVTDGNYNFRHPPFVFTELGVAMLSSVLNSPKSIAVNISIMRAFVKLRSFLAMESHFNEKVNKLEKGTAKLFKIVFERLDGLEECIVTKIPQRKKKIGIKDSNE